MATNLQEVVETAIPTDISEQEILGLRAELNGELEEVLSGWDRPNEPLRITKDRLRRSENCTAQLLGGGPAELNENIAVGLVVDAAASVVAISPGAPYGRTRNGRSEPGTWQQAIAEPLRIENPDLGNWYEALGPEEREAYNETVETRCEELKKAIADLTEFTVISQHWTIVELASNVILSAKPDLVVLGPERAIFEIKSGQGYGIGNELAFYALVESLSQGSAPSVVAGVSMVPSTVVRSQRVDLDLLYRTADQVVLAARRCQAADQSVANNKWPLTTPGPHCKICDVAKRCSSFPDEFLQEGHLETNHEIYDDFDYAEEEV